MHMQQSVFLTSKRQLRNQTALYLQELNLLRVVLCKPIHAARVRSGPTGANYLSLAATIMHSTLLVTTHFLMQNPYASILCSAQYDINQKWVKVP